MNTLERILSALNCEKTDKTPVASFMTGVTVESMDICGFNWNEAHHDADKLTTLAAAAYEHCGLDTLKLPFDMVVEAEALGGKVDFGTKDTLPQMRSHLFDDPDELNFDSGLLNKGRIPLILNAISSAKSRYSPNAAVVSSIVGPFTLGCKLFGFDNFFEWLLLEPEKLHQAMEKLTDLCIMYSKKQAEAGADVIQLGEASSSGDLISSDTYQNFIAPYHKKFCKEIKTPAVVHICGNITGHLPYILNTGIAGISFDEKTNVSKVREILKGKVAIIGYVDTLEVLLKGTPELVYEKSLECIKEGVDILNAGCAWPPYVKNANIKAMVSASFAK